MLRVLPTLALGFPSIAWDFVLWDLTHPAPLRENCWQRPLGHRAFSSGAVAQILFSRLCGLLLRVPVGELAQNRVPNDPQPQAIWFALEESYVTGLQPHFMDVGGRDCERQGPSMFAEGHRFQFFKNTPNIYPNYT